MKRTITFLFLLAYVSVRAQITNGGFESVNSLNIATYWAGQTYLMDFTIDSSGHFRTDSVIYDGGGNYRINSTNPYEGSNAVELRNAYNYNKKRLMPGVIFTAVDTTGYTGFGHNPIPTTAGQRPKELGFHYMFTRVNNDTAYAHIVVYDEGGEEIGRGIMDITEARQSYTKASIPVVYNSTNPAAFFEVMFSTSKSLQNGSVGTRLVIDAVTLENTTDINQLKISGNAPQVFPNPNSGEFYIMFKQPEVVTSIIMSDMTGKVVEYIDPINMPVRCATCSEGAYVMLVQTTNTVYKYKIVVRR